VHLVGFYYKNISRCTVLWMSNSAATCFGCPNQPSSGCVYHRMWKTTVWWWRFPMKNFI